MVSVSVIIPSYNEELAIKNCIMSIRKQTKKPLEIILVDGCSKDKTVEIAKPLVDKVDHRKNKTIAEARNIGATMAKGDVIAYIDADSVAKPDWIARLSKHYEDPNVVAVGGVAKPKNKSFKHRTMFYLINDLYPSIASKFNFFSFIGSNCSFRRETFKKIGGFDEELAAMEDNEIGNRIKHEGRVVFDRNMVVYTSTRRMERKGYLRLALYFWRAYFEIYVLKRGFRREYGVIRRTSEKVKRKKNNKNNKGAK